MKKFFTLVVLALLAVGCAKEYDDTGLRELIAGLDVRVSELEANVSALQSTLGDGKFVRKVEEYRDPDTGRTTGVTVTYTDGNIVHFNIVPSDPALGPVFSVIRNGAGMLVWAVDGQAIQLDGAEVPVYQTPAFSIDEEGNLWVEVDGKSTNLGPVKSEGATLQDGIFMNLAVTGNAVVLTLSDGSTVNIPFAEAFVLNIETTEFTFSGLDPIEVPYTVSARTEGTVVGVAGYSPKEFNVAVEADKIVVTPLSKSAAAVMMAYADSKVGLVSVVNLKFEAEGFEITDEPASAEYDYIAEGEDAVIVANAVSNIAFDVKPVEEWIHVAGVRSQASAITLKLDDNKTGAIREGTVNIVRAGTEEVVQTIRIAQLPAIDEAGPKNLSKKGAANSYIVTEAGEYKFWAVKGNSGIEVNPATVEVLWETWNNGEEVTPNSVIASVSLQGSYVVIATPATLKPGNAVIAAKDAAGVILWSWHIWVPATEIATVNYGIYSAPMMDRNLGALVAATADAAAPVESFGLNYQWGRKDPFPGAKAVSSGDNATVAGIAVSTKPGSGTSDESCMSSVEEAVANPTVLGFTQNGDWLPAAAADNTLWQNEVKTMYDPCPPGYRVPARDTESAFHSSDLSTATGWNDNAANYWFALGDPLAVFPYAGYRDDYSPKGLTHAYDRGAYWTAYSSQDAKAYYVNVRAGSTHARAEAGKSRAGSVRCVSAEETPILPPDEPTEPVGGATDLSAEASANSYIVTKAGDYKFKAVKGNSAESVGAVAKAELLWETENTATAPEVNAIIAQVGVDGDFITFSTAGTLKPGNALIAAKDASDAVLWSWHIWIPATEVAVIDAEALCGAKMMDRNLGALVATSMTGDPDPLSIGTFYQWGRKDPFPGMASFTENTAAKAAGTEWSSHGELVSTEYAIAHPTEYIHVPGVDAGVWNADDPKDLWNTAENGKTVYDPCPAGYRVPLYSSSLPMWSGSFGDGWTIDQANFRFAYGENVFPVAGYIDCWTPSYEKIGLRTHIWAASWYDGERSNCLYYREGAYYSQKFHKAKAGSVRCVAE